MTPDFRLIADTQDVTETFRDRLLSLRLTDEAGEKSDTFECQLDDRDNLIVWPSHGAELEVSLGYKETGVVNKGIFIVDEVEHTGPPDTIIIRGKAANLRSSLKEQKTRSWNDLTIGRLVNTIASEHQLTPRVATTMQHITLVHVDQTNESDLHLLTRIARDQGALAKPIKKHLVFVPKGEAKTVTGNAMPTIHIVKKHIIRHRMTQAERSKYQAVRAYWYAVEIGEKVAVMVGEGSPAYTLRHDYPNAEAATHAANAKLRSLKRGTATLSLTLLGNPELQAEGKLSISGVRDPIDGEWVVHRVEYELNQQGLSTRCDAALSN